MGADQVTRENTEPSRRLLWLAALLLPLLIAVISFPGASRHLWEEDTIGFALALDSFSLTDYTPHPPGYIFYVFAARAVNALSGDPNTTFLALGFAANVAAAWLILWLGTALGGRDVGLLSALLWPFNSIVWFYAQVSTVYPFEGLCAVAVAAATYKMLQGRRAWVFVSAAVLGLAGGFRGFVVVMLLPLWVYGLLSSQAGWKDRLGSLGVLAAAYGSWLVPTIWLAGGYQAYGDASRRLFLYNLKRTSVLWSGDISKLLFNLSLFGHFSLMGLGLLGMVVLLAGLFLPSVRRTYFSGPRNMRHVWFFTLWIGVPSLFFILFHLAKAGYLMIFLPAWAILIAWGVVSAAGVISKERSASRWVFIATLLAAHVLVAAFVHTKITQRLVIQASDTNMESLLNAVRSGPCVEPKQCLLIVYGLPWRNTAYYMPEVRMVVLADEASTWYPAYGAEVAYAKERRVRYASGTIIWASAPRPSEQEVLVPPEAKTILWFVDTRSAFFDELMKRMPLEGSLLNQEMGSGALYETSRELLELPIKLGAFRLIDGPKAKE
jgi:4-amino-4-deoxy-L-arabinose transferase-like glycosyltransferase